MIEQSIVERGHRIRFLIYATSTYLPEVPIRAITQALARIPRAHVNCIPTCIVMKRIPNASRGGGGTWREHEWRGAFSGEYAQRDTEIPFDELESALGPSHFGAVIGMAKDAWKHTPASTFMHEVGHMVHNEFGLLAERVEDQNFDGMMSDRCGVGSHLVRKAVEAYARRYAMPSFVSHFVPLGTDQQRVNAALRATLDLSPAYTMADRSTSH